MSDIKKIYFLIPLIIFGLIFGFSLACGGSPPASVERDRDPNETEGEFKSSCEVVSYDELLRYPEKYEGDRVNVKGEVVQTTNYGFLHMNITEGDYGFWDDRTYIYLPDEGPSIIEEDIIEVWGYASGVDTYKTVLGSENTIPVIYAEYIEILDKTTETSTSNSTDKEVSDDEAETKTEEIVEKPEEEQSVSTQSDTDDVLNEIMEKAKSDWPNDKDMQEFQYNNQVGAYNKILDLPNTSDYREDILIKTQTDWPGDFEMQLFQYDNQLDAYHDILNLPNTSDYHDGILADAQKDWPGDYEMQLFQYDNQLDAYHDILNLPNTSDYNEAALNRAKSDWPGDYEMQLWQYNNEK